MGFSRRRFIECTCKSVTAVTMASAFRRFGLMNAYAQTVSDYKALVCVFLFGGNDGNNLIVPTDVNGVPASNYTTVRGGSSIALPQFTQASLVTSLTNTPYGNYFGFHPTMPEIASLFGAGKVAVLANTGPLVAPTTRAQYLARSVALPVNLFSHSDQQNEWQTSAKNSLSVVGWGGKIADAMQYANAGAQYPVAVSTAGSVVFASGNQTQPVNIVAGASSSVTCTPGSSSSASAATAADCSSRTAALQQLLTFDTGASLIQATSDVTSRSFLYTQLLTDAQAHTSVPAITTVFPAGNGLADQLKQVAEIIRVRGDLGMKRQIFFVSLGGFDTHTAQGTTTGTGAQPNLLTQLSQAMNAFNNAMAELGVSNSVTSFTLSDFARTFQPNTGGGSDHAWGGHQLIMGGAVQGQKIYGQFPTLVLGGPDDSSSNGRWIPSTSIDQFGATLAKWFGVADANLPSIFPNLPNFTTKDMGFMG